MEDASHEEFRVRLSITPRKIRIEASERRREYVRRLERIMTQCDEIISDPSGFEEIQLQAMAILIRAIVVSYELVSDEQVDELEEELGKIKARLAEKYGGHKAEP